VSHFFSKFLNRLRVVFHIDIEPHQPRNAEDVDKIGSQKNDEQAERGHLAPAQKPVKKGDEKQAKPPRPDVRNEHGAVVVTRFGEKVEVALGAALEHFDGFDERPTARLESFAFVATRAFEVKNAIGFGAFFKKRHKVAMLKNHVLLKRRPKIECRAAYFYPRHHEFSTMTKLTNAPDERHSK
jgi:hypothetical protein